MTHTHSLIRAVVLLLSIACCRAVALGGGAAAQVSLITNGSFDRDVADWAQWFSPGQGEGEGRWVPRDGGGAMHVVVRRRTHASSIQIYQGPFAIRKGAWYAVSFEARAARPTGLRVSLMRHSAPWRGFGLSADLTLGTKWQRFSLPVQASESSDNARIDFFPAATCWLDNVTVRELGEQPPTWPVEAVRPGPGWRGDPKRLMDGKPQSSIHCGYHPVLPALVTLDLGQPRPVGAVVVRAVEWGRHERLQRLAVEVSADGKAWHRWASASRTTTGGEGGRRDTRFVAASVAVPVRYVRIRVRRVRQVARLAEATIIAGEAADPATLAALARVAPEENVAFLGWDYDSVGYALSPGEPVALRFANQGDQPVAAPLAWRLETYAGDRLAYGKAALKLDARATADVPLAFPKTLKDGPHRLRFTLGTAEREQAFYFDYRVAQKHDVLSLRVAALLDCLDPEGWVKLTAGPLAPYIDVRRSLPADPKAIDATLVMAENWPKDAPQVVALRRYLAAGGRAVFFGKVAESMTDLLPVEIDRERPWLDTPQRLERPSIWRDWKLADGPMHYAVRVKTKPDARVLASWQSGAAAVVEGRCGAGRTVYVGVPLGRTWKQGAVDELMVRVLMHITGRRVGSGALEALRPDVDNPLRGNIGRFGWRVDEGGLVENVSADGEVRCPADPTPWRMAVAVRGVLKGRSRTAPNWLAKTVEWRDGQGSVMTSTISSASPYVLWECRTTRLGLTGRISHVTVATRTGVRVLKRGEAVTGDALAAGWLVLLRAEAEHRDVPRVVVLTRRPKAVRLAEALELTFGKEGCGAIFTGRLFGLRRLAPGATCAWAKAFPESAARQATRAASQCLAFPVACAEAFQADGDAVVVTCRVRHRTVADAWHTRPSPLAPLPPVLSLARQHGYPVEVSGKVVSMGVATKYGPLEAVEGNTVTYRLPLPPLDHFGVIPVEGKMDLADEIDRRGVQGISTVKRAPGGLVTGDAFLADLRAYMGAGRFPPFESPHLDLYKWWFCFPTVLGRPAYGLKARETIDAHHRDHYWRTLNFHPHKALIRYRREPWTGRDYAVSFIWPVSFRDGVRYFCDQNESAAVILYCLWSYAHYYGDWTTARSNWNLAQYVHRYLTRFHDWALMASSNQAYFSTVGIDMLNSEMPGNLAFARIARQMGDKRAEQLGLYLAAKAAVPTVARLYMPDYIHSITAEGDPWREWKWFWSFHEGRVGGLKTLVARGGSDMAAALAIGLLDTSKGTSPEIALLYKQYAPKRMAAYERDIEAFAKEHGVASGWAHLMQRAMLGWPRGELIAEARRFQAEKPKWGWQSTKAPGNLAMVCVADTPLFLADWAPAEYVGARFTPDDDTVRLTFATHEARPCTIRLYSQRTPVDVRVNNAPHKTWSYDTKTGWVRITLPGRSVTRLAIRLGKEAKAPLHPYFGRPAAHGL